MEGRKPVCIHILAYYARIDYIVGGFNSRYGEFRLSLTLLHPVQGGGFLSIYADSVPVGPIDPIYAVHQFSEAGLAFEGGCKREGGRCFDRLRFGFGFGSDSRLPVAGIRKERNCREQRNVID